MRIVDVNEFYAKRGGGVRNYVEAKFEAARRHGVELIVIAPGPEDKRENRLGGSIVWVKSPPLPLDKRYYLLLRERAVHAILDSLAPDLSEGSSTWTGGWFVGSFRGPGAKTLVFHQDPVAVYGHTLFDRWLPRPAIDALAGPWWSYLRRLSHRFDATVVAGQWLADRLAHFGIKQPVAVPFGIHKQQFSPTRRDVSVRAGLLALCGVPEDGVLLAAASRHHPEKRLGTLFAALRRLNGKHQTRRYGLAIFGDGPLRPWVEKQAANTPGAYVAGFIDDKAELASALASADVLLHGSAAETFGFVVSEAICSGLPLVVPDAGGAFEMASSRFAEVYRAGDSLACAAAVERLLARPRRELARALEKACVTRVWNIERHFAELFHFYAHLAHGKKGQSSETSLAEAAA
jgi:alpha-1,6-mannosyltransferase